jgi:histone acetyltransferase (RNA polymerase elongator complex component)
MVRCLITDGLAYCYYCNDTEEKTDGTEGYDKTTKKAKKNINAPRIQINSRLKDITTKCCLAERSTAKLT